MKTKKILLLFLSLVLSLCLVACNFTPSDQEDPGEQEDKTCKHENYEWVVITDATCTSEGVMNKVCKDCKEVLETASIEKKEHTLVYDDDLEATCEHDGVTGGCYCSVCHTIFSGTVIPALEHEVVVDQAKEATCTENGLTEGSHCSVCNTVIVAQEVIEKLGHDYEIIDSKEATKTEEGYATYKCTRCNDEYTVTIPKKTDYNEDEDIEIILSDDLSYVNNNNGGVVIENNIVTISMAGEYVISGTLSEGQIIVKATEEDKVTLTLCGLSITSAKDSPIYVECADKVEISAKNKTENFVYDKRTYTTDASGAAIYANTDLEIKGKGSLTVEASYNNGIASKDDLEIKNLTLSVKAINNAIKGNDSLTIESGTVTAISTGGDALKTENSDISSKGNQRGTVTIEDGTINLYAACDGIDASYDVIINGGTLSIYTEEYSEYSEEVLVSEETTIYFRISGRTSLTTAYKYSALFIDDAGVETWVNGTYKQNGQYKNYEFEKPSGAKYVKFFAYTSAQTQGQATTYSFATDQLTIPTSNDTFYASSTRGNVIQGSWTGSQTGSTGQGGFGPGGYGPGGGMGGDGNSDKTDYSCKGIKADNEIVINNGTITIKAHDDAIHTNNDVSLENGETALGNVTINDGTLVLTTEDDGIHADNVLSINGGNIRILTSYEGVEGTTINFTDGVTEINASDDGINAYTLINITGGIIYLNADGDGIDSNNQVTMSGGVMLAQGPRNGGNGVIDFERSFSFSGGLLLAIGCSGMNQKPTATSGNTSQSKTISTNTSSYVNVVVSDEIVATIKVTKNNQNYCVLAYNNTTYKNATVTVTTSTSNTLTNDLYYVK